MQTWEEQGENEVAYLELVKRQKAGAYTPYHEVARWRRIAWWSIGWNFVQVGIIWYLVFKGK